MACNHNWNGLGSCPFCSSQPITFTTGTGTTTTTGSLLGVGTPTVSWTPATTYQPTPMLDSHLMMAKRIKELEGELDKMTDTLHDALKKEVEWQERIDTLTGEREVLMRLMDEAIAELQKMIVLFQVAVEGKAEWIPEKPN